MQSNIERIHKESDGTVTPESVAELIKQVLPYTSDSAALAQAKLMLGTLKSKPIFWEKYDTTIYLATVLIVIAIGNPVFFAVN